MKREKTGRRIEGGEEGDFLKGTRKNDVIYGHAGDDTIVGGRGADVLYGGTGSDVFVFNDRHAGDVSFGRADAIGDFTSEDIIDLSKTEVIYFAGYDVISPERGGFSIWETQGDVYVTWNTFGEFHDVKLTDFDGDYYNLLGQIQWYDDDYAGSVATGGSIEAGGAVTGTIEVDTDQDWFRIELEEGLLYSFDLRGEADGGGTLLDPYLVLYDEFGGYVMEGYEALDFLAGAPGTYFISAESFGSTGSYTLAAAAEVYVDDFGDDATTAGAIAPGETVDGVINASFDQDWFRVELEEGLLYSFDLQGEAHDGGTLLDPYLVLYDEFGDYVADGYEALDFLADAPGTYFISAESFGSTGSYTLTAAAEVYVDDFGDDVTTAGAIAPGETVDGVIGTPFDQDWFRIELEKGLLYSFDLRGEADDGGTLLDPYLVLYDEFGDYVADGYEALVFAADAPGTYFISAESFGSTGSYTLAAELYADDSGDDATTAGAIAPGETVDGVIGTPFDQDWFRIELEEGETYTIDLRGQSSGSGSLPDPFLRLLDDEGQELASNDDTDGLDSQIVYTAESAGTYFIAASELDSGVGTYDLSVSDPGGELLFG